MDQVPGSKCSPILDVALCIDSRRDIQCNLTSLGKKQFLQGHDRRKHEPRFPVMILEKHFYFFCLQSDREFVTYRDCNRILRQFCYWLTACRHHKGSYIPNQVYILAQKHTRLIRTGTLGHWPLRSARQLDIGNLHTARSIHMLHIHCDRF